MTPTSCEDRALLRRALETSTRLGLGLVLVVWCFQLARPFLEPIVWGRILAVATHPIFASICRITGRRTSLGAGILVLAALLVLIVPSVVLTRNVGDTATQLAEQVEAGTLEVPPPPDGVEGWPIVGDRVHAVWASASRYLDAAVDPLRPQLKAVSRWGFASHSAGSRDRAAHRRLAHRRRSQRRHPEAPATRPG
ncbi:MAG: AI-2E family transporter [Deltaproteobacteria bacterium]|jgi:predicted PurR-regulated permease PerM|nr:AI-2E family transporter [Deltaproteobacteria bacterium]MBW2500359.1 AI-2E family transporter [Deltaproteobacteria bacterium]